MKRLSIFDLQEGKIYAAFDGDRRLSKNYTVQNGHLMNADRDEDPNDLTVYEGCEWVPLKASVNFKEIGESTQGTTNILGLKQGIAYSGSAELAGVLVARKGNKLFQLDNKKKFTKAVDLATIELSTMFTVVEKLPTSTKKIAKRMVTAKSKTKNSSRSSARR